MEVWGLCRVNIRRWWKADILGLRRRMVRLLPAPGARLHEPQPVRWQTNGPMPFRVVLKDRWQGASLRARRRPDHQPTGPFTILAADRGIAPDRAVGQGDGLVPGACQSGTGRSAAGG